MPDYQLFGGVLRSELDFPELPLGVGDVSWTLRVVTGRPSLPVGEPLGADEVNGETKVRSYRTTGGLALVYDDTGRFDITADGREITWFEPSGGLRAPACADVIGRVLPLALHRQGILCLHASAVAFGTEGVGFLAPKYHGKSSLASALVAAGGDLVTDDVLPVSPVGARYLPGVPSLQLWPDSAALLAHRNDGIRKESGKVMFAARQSSASMTSGRLATVYILTPVRDLPGGAVVERVRQPTIRASLAFVEYSRLGPLLSGPEAGALFELAVSVAAQVNVYELRVVRDLARLRDVADTLVAWHTQGVSTVTSGAV